MQIKTETRVGLFILVALAIFFYMTFRIGVFRFDMGSYASYIVNFKDVSGLLKKADVKIAGVKVGWVEELSLRKDEYEAQAQIMVLKRYKLRSDSYAIVRQDGLLGTKYLEIFPGDPLLSTLPPGSVLSKPSKAPVSVDELLYEFKNIAHNVQDVTSSLKDIFGSEEGKQRLSDSLRNIDHAVDQFASVTEILNRTMQNNEENINSILQDMRDFSANAREVMPHFGDDVRRLADRLDYDIFPAFQTSMEKISEVFDRDFNRVATRLEGTSDALEDAALQAREGMKNISSVAQKIDQGKGFLGKLVHDEDTYRDLQVAAQGLKNYFTVIDNLGIVFDTHFESMHKPGEHFADLKDAKAEGGTEKAGAAGCSL